MRSDKHISWRWPTGVLGHGAHILLPHLSHVSQHGEDDEAGQEAGQTVHRAGDQRVSEWEQGEKMKVAGRRQMIYITLIDGSTYIRI